ncbi:FecR family protein [Paraflavitalea soli]|uniref:FecR family protein n=1 Tax=Paraflavitalea soli TaxID=2315862 RepID=A0A3B7MIN7_9BACT|nr:FecR family protein [Paraflavitalea soli]AXY73447.1 FecR family protein [Paraflavitalea soli]
MNRFETLWKGYQQGLLQEAELAEFLQLIREDENLLAGGIDELLQHGPQGMPAPGEKELILRQIRQQIQPATVHKLPFGKRYWWIAAAALFLLTTMIALLTIRLKKQQDITGKGRQPSPVYDAAPGKNGALLTLADGSTIVLDSAANGTLAQQGSSKLIKTEDGKLTYSPSSGEGQEAPAYNTISTPRGRQFQLVLPDGSKVWLNAASSLTYPTAFTGNERKVTLTGEAYFEVASLPGKSGTKMSFLVDMRPIAGGKINGTIEVLGTHFNVNAYEDEGAIKATLLEGKIKITAVTGSQLLFPGHQALLSNNQLSIINNLDVEAVVAWKNGVFNFHKADLPAVMRQLSRWYDVEIVYQGPVPGRLFGGEIERNLHLSQVLKILSKMGIQCTIEGKKLIVQPS